MATKAEIREKAKALCFKACMDCKSADECDPDEAWFEDARAALKISPPPRRNSVASTSHSHVLRGRMFLSK
jgi:hypothetical protein